MVAKAKKSARRVSLIDAIVTSITDPVVMKRIGFSTKPEQAIQQALDTQLHDCLKQVITAQSPALRLETCIEKASAAVLWEGDQTIVINNLRLFGTQHRPDFVVSIDGTRIAIEVKRGDSGAAIREGLGQTMVYSRFYDFVVYVFFDTSPDGRIRAAALDEPEASLAEDLWELHNTRFVVA